VGTADPVPPKTLDILVVSQPPSMLQTIPPIPDVVVAATKVELESPTTSTVFCPVVWRAMIVVEGPEPIVIDEPGASVWLSMIN